jgi:3-oxoacyl-[acyl-carrier protein] reductase
VTAAPEIDLTGRVAVVTGGSRGIGRGVAELLASRGATVAVTYHSSEAEARALEAAAAARGHRVWAGACNVADERSIAAFFEAVKGEVGPVDVLVNNAAVTRDAHIVMMDTGRWESVLRTNLDGAYHCVRAVARGMLLRRWGRIVNITSPSATMPLPGQANYAASKAGLIGFTKAVALEVASRGITVNVVAPGLIETDMTRAMTADAREEWAAKIPLRRLGTPADVASAVCFLASDEASYITGHVLAVNGGMYT